MFCWLTTLVWALHTCQSWQLRTAYRLQYGTVVQGRRCRYFQARHLRSTVVAPFLVLVPSDSVYMHCIYVYIISHAWQAKNLFAWGHTFSVVRGDPPLIGSVSGTGENFIVPNKELSEQLCQRVPVGHGVRSYQWGARRLLGLHFCSLFAKGNSGLMLQKFL